MTLVNSAVHKGRGASAWVRPLLANLQMRHLGSLVVRQIQRRSPELIRLAWHAPRCSSQKLPPCITNRSRLKIGGKALWELALTSRAPALADRLDEFDVSKLVMTGDDDRIVPTADSIWLAGELPNARLVVIPNAGHDPHEEQPDAFMHAVTSFLK